MKKNIYIKTLLAIACAGGFASCSDEETYDFPGTTNNAVYTLFRSSGFSLLHTPAGAVENLDAEIPARCTQKAANEIKVTLEVDNSLVDAYNEANGTFYLPMPENAIVFENQTMTIPAGKMSAEEPARISLVDDADIIATLDAKQGYILPVRMASVSGASPAKSIESISYITLAVSREIVNVSGKIDDVNGTPVQDQSGWALTGNIDCNNGYMLFDGNPTKYTMFSNGQNAMELIVDMGKVYEFDAIEAKYAFASNPQYGYGSLGIGTAISISEDGNIWEDATTIQMGQSTQYIIFYGYVSARYIKLSFPARRSMRCGYFNVYAK